MEIIKFNYKNQASVIKITANYIKAGKTVVFPTDTVYGIICNAKNKKAVSKVFKIKKRALQKSLPIFVKDIKAAKKIAKINKEQERFLKKIWPGKVTVILKRKSRRKVGTPTKTSGLSNLYGIDKKNIAIRIPNYNLLNALLKKNNVTLAQTSANISGRNPAKTAKEVAKEFENKKEKPDLIIDAGKISKSKPSTIIDLTVFPPKIIRT